jgi:hypothetical protein
MIFFRGTCLAGPNPVRIAGFRDDSVRRSFLFLVIASAFGAARCGSNAGGSPTAPTSAVAPSQGGAAATVQISVNPNPVPFSGAPITDAAECANYANTWFYDTVLLENGGGNVTFTSRVDLFDGKTANNITGLKVVLGPHDTVVLHTRWCSGASTGHSAQSIFGGVDGNGNAVTATGQVAQLAGAGKQ